ncbi:MAG: hypothetical protein ACLFNW_12155 [Desulfobacterales bacterium]
MARIARETAPGFPHHIIQRGNPRQRVFFSDDYYSAFWSLLYGSGFWHLTRFNNTIVMGGQIVSLVCVLPVYFGCNALIRRYRTHIMTWVEKTRIAQMVKGSRIYSAYKNVSGWRGAV